jgi:hypothetical protein
VCENTKNGFPINAEAEKCERLNMYNKLRFDPLIVIIRSSFHFHCIIRKVGSVRRIFTFSLSPIDRPTDQLAGWLEENYPKCRIARSSCLIGTMNGVLPRLTYWYPFDHRSQAAMGPDSTWMGDHPNDKYAGCCLKVYPHLVAWEGVGEDTERSYSACQREISQNAPRQK